MVCSMFRRNRTNWGFLISVPSGAPQNINCQSRSPNSILLEWSKPNREDRNGIVRGYWLEYYPRTLWYGKSGNYQEYVPPNVMIIIQVN